MVEIADEKDDKKTMENDKIRWLYLIFSPQYLILSLDNLAKSNGFWMFKVAWSSIWTIFYTNKPRKSCRNNLKNFLYLDENVSLFGIRF